MLCSQRYFCRSDCTLTTDGVDSNVRVGMDVFECALRDQQPLGQTTRDKVETGKWSLILGKDDGKHWVDDGKRIRVGISNHENSEKSSDLVEL